MELDQSREDKKRKTTPAVAQVIQNQDDWTRFPEIEDKIKQFLINLKHTTESKSFENPVADDATKSQPNKSQQSSSRKPVEALKRKIDLTTLLNDTNRTTVSSQKAIVLQPRPTAIQDEQKTIAFAELLKKDKKSTFHVHDFDEFIFIIVLSEVTFTLFAIEKSAAITKTSDIQLNFLSQVKMQFQVIYQEQSYSRRLTCCETAFYFDQESPSSDPQICFLLGGDIGEIFILRDSDNGFAISRRQVCTGEIQQISVPIQNKHFKYENICLVLSQLEHIYLMNFTKGTIIAQFGNQGSSGPGKFLAATWHPSYEYFVSARENGGIELWKIDSTISAHVTEAFYSTKLPGKFFRKYIDMPSYYNWGIHVNQTGPLVFSSLLEHVLVTIDNLMVLRFTLLEIKNNESHVNILTVNLKILQSDIINIFTHNIELFIVTHKKIYVFSLSETQKLNIEVKDVTYTPENLKHLFVTKDFRYIIGLNDQSMFLNYQQLGVDEQSMQVEEEKRK